MEIEKLKVLLKEKYVSITEVYSVEDLSKNQDSYLLKDNSIIGINLKKCRYKRYCKSNSGN